MRVFSERKADESEQGRVGEAQLAARHIERPNHPPERFDDFPRLLDSLPELNAVAKQDNGNCVADYTIKNVGYKPRELEKLEPGTVLEESPGFHEVIERLAKCESNLREHPNPPAWVRKAVNREALRQRGLHEKRSGQSPESDGDNAESNDFFDAQQGKWLDGSLHPDRDTVRNAARTADLNVAADLDLLAPASILEAQMRTGFWAWSAATMSRRRRDASLRPARSAESYGLSEPVRRDVLCVTVTVVTRVTVTKPSPPRLRRDCQMHRAALYCDVIATQRRALPIPLNNHHALSPACHDL